jgi:hypothetical protein
MGISTGYTKNLEVYVLKGWLFSLESWRVEASPVLEVLFMEDLTEKRM